LAVLKKNEHSDGSGHQLFIDFKKAYNPFRRKEM